MVDRSVAQAKLAKLLPRHDSMLAPRKHRNCSIRMTLGRLTTIYVVNRPPVSHGAQDGGTCVTGGLRALRLVAFPQQAQARQRQQVVDFVDLFAVGDYRARQAACGYRDRLFVQLLADATDYCVHLAGEAEDRSGEQSGLGVLADRLLRLDGVDGEEPRGAGRPPVARSGAARGDPPAEVLAPGGGDVVRDRRPQGAR